MTVTPDQDALIKGLQVHFKTLDVCTGKGGFFVRGHSHISTARARAITGIKPATTKSPRKVHGGYGDYAILRKIVGRM